MGACCPRIPAAGPAGRVPAKPTDPAPPSLASTRMGKHSLLVSGHSTSVSLEEAFWTRLRALAERRGQSVAALVAAIDEGRGAANLSSAIRVYLLEAADGAQ